MIDEIQVLDAHKIDRKKWDQCVMDSPNCLIYGWSEYLNYTTDNWKGLVINDYEGVMPVPWRKKYGVVYTYNVPFLQQAGVYSNLPNINVEKIIGALRSVCSYGEYCFNFKYPVPSSQHLVNFILPLDAPYEEIHERFSSDAKGIIKKASNASFIYMKADADEAIRLFIELYGKRVRISAHQYNSFKNLCKSLQSRGHVIVKKIVDANGSTVAIVLMLSFQNRLYNVMNNTTDTGRQAGANYLLLAKVFEEFTMKGYTFDFEGSDEPGIQRFYKKFSGINQPYFRYRFNDLPWPLKMFKR